MPRRNPLDLDDAVDLCRTGDIWIFRGHSVADRAIRTFTNAPVNHVGMAVVLDDLPPLMWHAELGKGLRDAWTGDFHRGVQLHDLREAVTQWQGRYEQSAWLRQLEPETGADQEDGLMRAIARLDGVSFPKTARMAGRWLRGRTGRAGRRERAHRDQRPEVAYCAEVVAATMVEMGMLEPRYSISWYDPGTFWSGDRLPLREPWRLGEEIPVRAADTVSG